jgi:hypothetical protein
MTMTMTTKTKATTTHLYQATRDAYAALVRANANLRETKQVVADDDTLAEDAKACALQLARGVIEQRLRQLAISIELLEEHLLSLAPQMAPGEALKLADQFGKLREAVGTAALALSDDDDFDDYDADATSDDD